MTEKEPPKIKGLSAQEFSGWKGHPFTKFFLEYLREKQEFYKEAALEEWIAQGNIHEALRGQIIELESMRNITWEEIAMFYEEQTQPEEDELKEENAT